MTKEQEQQIKAAAASFFKSVSDTLGVPVDDEKVAIVALALFAGFFEGRTGRSSISKLCTVQALMPAA